MKMKLTTLCENTAFGSGIVAEWGWSIFIETEDINILFDTGGGNAAVRNADTLGIDLKTADKIVLSHAHPDHTGGLREVLMRLRSREVVTHPAVWIPKYKKESADKEMLYRGIPFAREELEKFANFTLSKEPKQISENILTTGEIPRITDYENIESDFFIKEEETFLSDTFPDDLALICKSNKGLVIVLGCAHRGIINTIRHAQKITGEDTVHTVIGGTHLYHKNEDQIEKTVQDLKELGVQNIGVSHCTGLKAAMKLADTFGKQFFFNNAGSVCTIE
jgi:7,8-dihydropterin-6-yl-methyl-4-(beta-D-ribofuranosyl)aminobenzene 5'-phosphate synthase